MASLSKEHGPLASTILQKPNFKLPTIIAYALAKLSRNPLTKDMESILREVMPNETASVDRMENIVGGYGHTSVTGMGHLTCTLERVSILESLYFFYQCRLQDGQETSTRYVDFSKGDSISLFTPPDPALPQVAQTKYYEILEQQIENYRGLLGPTIDYLAKKYDINKDDNNQALVLKARAFDCLRYLIPLATRTKVGAIQSAREWAKYIKISRTSENLTQREVGELLLSLLTKSKDNYTPEADILIRHTDPITNNIRKLMELVEVKRLGNAIAGRPEIGHIKELIEYSMATRLGKLKYPNNLATFVNCDQEALSKALFEEHSHHNEMGPLFQRGDNTIYGALDIGSLKDINRHRSLELFIPFLHEEAQVAKAILETAPKNQFLICPYIDPEDKLYWEYRTALIETYEAIQKWAGLLSGGPSCNISVKKLVPQAHLIQYEISGSLADWSYATQLRVRNGGHIAYREWAYDVAKTLAHHDHLFRGLLDKLPQPNAKDRGQFLDRS